MLENCENRCECYKCLNLINNYIQSVTIYRFSIIINQSTRVWLLYTFIFIYIYIVHRVLCFTSIPANHVSSMNVSQRL